MKTVVVVPNLNGEEYLRECLDSLRAQTAECTVLVVDNGSKDTSREIIKSYGDDIISIYLDKNYGFTGGVNPGIQYAIDHDFDGVALFNNDAIAKNDWLDNLNNVLKARKDVGIVTGCLQSINKETIDSTGEYYSFWGLPYPRGRGESIKEAGTGQVYIFGASGGASLYRVAMLKQIGLFDQDFFAYYEDVDISFRAQLTGFKIMYTPEAIAYHRIGATSTRMKSGFVIYQTFKNLPMVIVKNIPKGLKHVVLPRFFVAYTSFFWSAVFRGQGAPAIRGMFKFISLWSKKHREHQEIMRKQVVTTNYIFSIMTHDLPENSKKLRNLRSLWWRLQGKNS